MGGRIQVQKEIIEGKIRKVEGKMREKLKRERRV